MRCSLIVFLTVPLLAGPSLAQEQHNVIIRNNAFTPPVVKAEPGDSVRWAITTFTGNATISSGTACTADGLFQLGISGGPFGNNSVTWEVPLDIFQISPILTARLSEACPLHTIFSRFLSQCL